MSAFRIECAAANAAEFQRWIDERGGIALWRSVNLGNPGQSWSAPVRDPAGQVNGPPSWQCAFKPDAIVTNPAEVVVYTEVLFKAFRVALVRKSMAMKLTDHAQKRLDKAMTECLEKHKSAHYRTGVLEDGPSIGVFYTSTIVPLTEFKP